MLTLLKVDTNKQNKIKTVLTDVDSPGFVDNGDRLFHLQINAFGCDMGWKGGKLVRSASQGKSVTILYVDFLADRVSEVAKAVAFPVKAAHVFRVSNKLKSISISTSAGNIIVPIPSENAKPGGARMKLPINFINQPLVTYDDSYGVDHVDLSGIYLKKLEHDVSIVVQGDFSTNDVNSCINQAFQEVVFANILEAIATDGAFMSIGDSINEFVAAVVNCVGPNVAVDLQDSSQWIVWKV